MKDNLLIIGLCIGLLALILLKSASHANSYCIKKSYQAYKKTYLSRDGRIFEPSKQNTTTSEGQAYMLLRSYLANDKKTFDLVYKWAKNHIQRHDHLFSSLWGKDKDGEFKVLNKNTDSGADIGFAFALALADEKWHDKRYSKELEALTKSIWAQETIKVNDDIVLMPGAFEKHKEDVRVNTASFSPYAFKKIQKYDKHNNWNELVESSYKYLNMAIKKTPQGLPPTMFDIIDGEVHFLDKQDSLFTKKAAPIFAKIYLDYKFTKDQRALEVLEQSKIFIKEWEKSGTVHPYPQTLNDKETKNEHAGSIAILIPAINLYNAKVAEEIFKEVLSPIFDDKKYWDVRTNAYEQSMLWFGCYLYKRR